MIKFLPGIFDRAAAAWDAFWHPPEKVPLIYSPQPIPLQSFHANAGGETRLVRPERAGPPGSLIVRSDDDGETIFFGIIARDAVVAEDRRKFDDAHAALAGE